MKLNKFYHFSFGLPLNWKNLCSNQKTSQNEAPFVLALLNDDPTCIRVRPVFPAKLRRFFELFFELKVRKSFFLIIHFKKSEFTAAAAVAAVFRPDEVEGC